MVTLHAYALRELLKTFGLTLAALTAVFTMGGGLYNILSYEGVNAGDLFGVIPMLIPIVMTLTMPVAALFATTMVYGRLAADNELQACRAAGINIHRLFVAAVLLAVFVAAFTLLFGDLVIPDFIHRLDRYARANLRDMALQRFQVKGHVRYEPRGESYLLTARSAKVPTARALEERSLPVADGISYLLIEEPVFLQIDAQGALVRCAAAEFGLCQFDGRTTPIEVTLYVKEGRDFDVRGRSVRLGRQPLGPIPVPIPFKRRASMVDLATLVRWREQPWETDQLRPDVRSFRRALEQQHFAQTAAELIAAGRPLVLTGERDKQYSISAAGAEPGRRGLTLTGVRVEKLAADGEDPLYYEAPVALLTPWSMERLAGALRLQLRATDQLVVEHNPRAREYAAGRTMTNLALPDPLHVPDELLADIGRFTDADIFDPTVVLPTSTELEAQRAELQVEAGRQSRKMAAVFHFRLGYASSTVVTVLMAAVLGVIFRGARALAAFALSCIPLGTVLVLMVMARSLGEKEGTEILSPVFTWGGLGALALVDALILRLGVRR